MERESYQIRDVAQHVPHAPNPPLIALQEYRSFFQDSGTEEGRVAYRDVYKTRNGFEINEKDGELKTMNYETSNYCKSSAQDQRLGIQGLLESFIETHFSGASDKGLDIIISAYETMETCDRVVRKIGSKRSSNTFRRCSVSLFQECTRLLDIRRKCERSQTKI